MGKRDRRRSRDRRKAKREGESPRRSRSKKPKLRLLQDEQPIDLLTLLKRMAAEGARIDAELRRGPRRFEVGEGPLDVSQYRCWTSLVPHSG